MVRARPTLPAGHGEVLTRPDVGEWPSLVAANRRQAETWAFEVGGLPALALRELARAEAIEQGESFSRRLGVPIAPSGSPQEPIVATGHQPELYHTGIWVKNFLLERLALEVGATAIDFVVDSDGYDTVQIISPCMTPGVQRCRQYLAVGTPDTCYACTPAPDAAAIEGFLDASASQLSTLPAPAVSRHFARFGDCLRLAQRDAEDLGQLVTIARRRYEEPAGTTYLELPVTWMAATAAATRFFAHVALDARAFARAYNAELAEYRAATNTRSAAQPFPDLAIDDDRVELPFWFIAEGHRRALWARPSDDGVDLLVDEDCVAHLDADPARAQSVLAAAGAIVAPKAVPLTMFTRLFASDLFIHGVGGARYDRVTDAVIRRYFGIEPPEFVVASMTMYLPLGAHVVTDEEVAAATEAINRFEHNPDQVLGDVEFEDPQEQHRAAELAAEKAGLLEAIAAPDADKKSIGRRIREVNAALGDILAPFGEELRAEKARLEAARADSEVLIDRTYPFAFWSPEEIADKVR